MPKARYHHGDLRRALMDEMTALVDARGVEAATVRDASRLAGVSEAAPYHHFRGKTDLLAAIAFQGYAALVAAMRAGADGLDAPDARLAAVGWAYLRFALENRGRYRVMFGEQMVEVASTVPPEALAEGQEVTRFSQAVAREVAAAAGHPERGEAVHRVVWSMVHGAASLLLERELRFEDEAEREGFLADVIAGTVAAARAVAAG